MKSCGGDGSGILSDIACAALFAAWNMRIPPPRHSPHAPDAEA